MFQLRTLPSIALGVLLCALPASAGEIDLYVNDDSARASVLLPLRATGLDVDFGFLHNRDDGDMGHAGIYVAGLAGKGSSTFEASLGGRVLLVETDGGDGTAIGLGGRVLYELSRVERLQFGAFLFFAPESTAFGDLEDVLDAGVHAGYRILDRASIYLAATTTSVDFDPTGDATVDNGLHVGFRIEF